MIKDLILDSEAKEKTPFILVVHNPNYADEFYLYSAEVMERKKWEELQAKVKELFSKGRKLRQSIGSNQEITYEFFNNWLSYYRVYSLPFNEETIEVLRVAMNLVNRHFFWPDTEDYSEDE